METRRLGLGLEHADLCADYAVMPVSILLVSRSVYVLALSAFNAETAAQEKSGALTATLHVHCTGTLASRDNDVCVNPLIALVAQGHRRYLLKGHARHTVQRSEVLSQPRAHQTDAPYLERLRDFPAGGGYRRALATLGDPCEDYAESSVAEQWLVDAAHLDGMDERERRGRRNPYSLVPTAMVDGYLCRELAGWYEAQGAFATKVVVRLRRFHNAMRRRLHHCPVLHVRVELSHMPFHPDAAFNLFQWVREMFDSINRTLRRSLTDLHVAVTLVAHPEDGAELHDAVADPTEHFQLDKATVAVVADANVLRCDRPCERSLWVIGHTDMESDEEFLGSDDGSFGRRFAFDSDTESEADGVEMEAPEA